MQDRPTARELLGTIADLLEGEVLAATGGPLKHQVRVAGNLCRIVERELELGPAQDRREAELLAGVLGAQSGEGEGEASTLSARLTERLLAGPDPDLERRAWPALVEIVRGKLAVAKPGHDAYDFESELDT